MVGCSVVIFSAVGVDSVFVVLFSLSVLVSLVASFAAFSNLILSSLTLPSNFLKFALHLRMNSVFGNVLACFGPFKPQFLKSPCTFLFMIFISSTSGVEPAFETSL